MTEQHTTLGLLQGWLDIGAIGHFIAVVLHLGWTNIAGLLFVNLYFYIFNQQRFRAGLAMNSSPAASPARCDTIKTLHDEMKKNICYIFAYLFLVTAIVSCSKHYKLKKDDLKYIPYKGNEVLVFQSDKARMDTTFLKGMSNFNGCGDPLAISPNQCDGIRFNCTRTDPNYDRYLDGKQLVELVATQNGVTRISFDIVLRGSWFYSMDSYSLSEFDKIPTTELTIDNKIYKDVKVFEVSDYAKQFRQRDNYAERFYWSVSKGLLGLDRRDEKWRLIKIYEP